MLRQNHHQNVTKTSLPKQNYNRVDDHQDSGNGSRGCEPTQTKQTWQGWVLANVRVVTNQQP
jgi:hypothetical protein